MKLAAAHAGGCRHVLLMSCSAPVLEAARQQRSIVAGDPPAVCAFLRDWAAQTQEAVREVHRARTAALAAEATAAAAAAEAAAEEPQPPPRATKAVRFSAVLDDGGTRRGYRGYSPPPEGDADEGAAAASAVDEQPRPSRKREREGAALSAAWDAARE